MPRKLTIAEQRKLARSIPLHRARAARRMARAAEQRGDGLKAIFAKIKSALGPLAKEFGPQIVKEIAIPMLKKKLVGKGLYLAGQR